MTATSVDLTKLTLEEQRQNLLRVARDVLARPDTLDMEVYHDLTAEQWLLVQPFNFVSGKANSAKWRPKTAALCIASPDTPLPTPERPAFSSPLTAATVRPAACCLGLKRPIISLMTTTTLLTSFEQF
jgi:hypothetical protein